jgi:predicted tellurium resistance membrane protein TerC
MLDWIAPLLTLTAMEVVLGIDNVLFLAIVANRLPANEQGLARRWGLGLALGTRLLLLLSLSWMLSLTDPVFRLSDLGLPADWFAPATNEISWRDIILIAGGLFLIGKSTYEIHEKLEGTGPHTTVKPAARFGWTLVQIAILDIVFSLDSVITAIGMAEHLWVMIVAMVIAAGIMLFFAGPISNFAQQHPTVQMLALSFLILIGIMLVAEGVEKHIERGYIYFAMFFSLIVELLNLRMRKSHAPVPGSKQELK